MYIEVLTSGYAVPQPNFDATVHSVFQSAANLRLTRDGKLLTLVTAGEADLPQGIRLNSPTGFSFDGLQVGEALVCRGGLVRLDKLALTISFHNAITWKCDLPALKMDFAKLEVQSAWRVVWNVLNTRQLLAKAEIVADNLFRPGEEPQAVMPKKARLAMQVLVRATQEADLMAASAAAKILTGLGPGLTPAGDDLLAGYLAGLWCAVGDHRDHVQFVSNLGKQVVRLSRRTNDISRTYLDHAVNGQVSSRFAALVEAISRGESPEALLKIAENAMHCGHTSGMDTVTGLLVGIFAWNEALIMPMMPASGVVCSP